ncbi:MAG: Mut7-C ubiquitin/RNAse domain-containing protein [Ignavibacteriaceae bacterium]|nr:Mut7-C ubiquitin/RNAse domain-containing protein [Ignavibacteriaceae bacterium]
MLKKVTLRFYEELNDFLPPDKRKKRFEHSFIDRTSIKDMIESLGVPHTEIDLILVNGVSVNLAYLVKDKDDISVYPMFESLDITNLQHLRAKPLRKPKFILDVHLGTLAKYMRMLGFDTLYKNNFNDDEIVNISLKERRAILTRDRGILKRTEVTHGYWVRSTKPREQIFEVINRFDLKSVVKELSRCLVCNSLLKIISKKKIIDRLPPKVKEYQTKFYYCKECSKIYWKGSHYTNMLTVIEKLI